MAQSAALREASLGLKKVCRFCLSDQKLASIFVENTRIKTSANLALQIMAITAIEVFDGDGMPGYICLDCRLLFEHCYRFKQMCKRAETLIRQYPLTGTWPAPLEKPRAPMIANQAVPPKNVTAVTVTSPESKPKKLLNTMAKSNKAIIENVQVLETSLLNKNATAGGAPIGRKAQAYELKVENNQDLTIDDVHSMMEDMANELQDEIVQPPAKNSPSKPKLLNKSSIRILNKGPAAPLEPRIATPQVHRDESGNVAIVTEILDPGKIISPNDLIKNAEKVATNVFPCPDCDRSFPLQQLLDIHMVNHKRERSFQCPDCERSFFSKYDLQKHTFVHTGERPFQCTICSRAFTRKALLHRHERTHTDIPKFICVFCEKPFISRQEMETHAERHTKKRPFHCGVCSKSFAFKQGLERHEVIHKTNLPFPCQHCNRSFPTSSKLARHLVAHAGKRAYPCKYCSKSYILSHHLSRHLRMHKQSTSEASFVCSECKDTFTTYDQLLEHSLTHAQDTLKCPLCRENIEYADDVEAHMAQHKTERFACEFCDHIFLSEARLRNHIEDDHVVDMMPYQNDEVEGAESVEGVEAAESIEGVEGAESVEGVGEKAEGEEALEEVYDAVGIKAEEEFITEYLEDDSLEDDHLDDSDGSFEPPPKQKKLVKESTEGKRQTRSQD
ncbi:hypothetical protein KR059_005705, partial [Drosophila kikkawai]